MMSTFQRTQRPGRGLYEVTPIHRLPDTGEQWSYAEEVAVFQEEQEAIETAQSIMEEHEEIFRVRIRYIREVGFVNRG